MRIRMAHPTESSILTDLAVSSEAYWEFGQEFLDIFKEQYSLTEKYIETNNVLVLEDSSHILGFFSLETDGNILNHFYISNSFIGSGYGRLMWDLLISHCEDEAINIFSLVATPEVVGFYTRLGAEIVGTGRSTINNRKVYFLEYKL